MIRACPACDAADVIRRIRLGGFRCNECTEIFDEPVMRKTKTPNHHRTGGLSPIGMAAMEWQDEEGEHAD